MQQWKKKIVQLALELDDIADKNIYRLRKRLGITDPVQVVPYRTYGTAEKIYVRGRVLEDKNIATAGDDDSLLTNVLNMYKRFESDEVAGATVFLDLAGATHETVTDKEGYFVFNLAVAEPLDRTDLYHSFPVRVMHPLPGSVADAEMMVPPIDAEYGIISDIDDTIIRTGATSLLAMGKTVLINNALTRLPFAGVAAFYKSLQLGRNGKRNNPFFYVSSSPWNLYDLLTDFMDHNAIPAGPLLLRDFGIRSESFMSGDYMSHKFKEISRILETYPHLNFVLAGDSGEQDPPIYAEVVKQYPGRILSIYIRDVAAGEKKAMAEKIAADLENLGVEMLLTEHSVNAAEHAAASGLIFREEIPAIVADKKADTGQAPGKLETALTAGDADKSMTV